MIDRGPWIDPAKELPQECETVQVLIGGGRTAHATWTGSLWWCSEELFPQGWRRMESRQIVCTAPRTG